MASLAPLLVCSPCRPGRPLRRSEEPNGRQRGRTLPPRVVLRANEVSRSGLRLALSISRLARKGRPLPRVIAVELKADDPTHFLVAANLLCLTAPTPNSRRLLRRLRRPTEGRQTPRGDDNRARGPADPRARELGRLEVLLTRRRTPLAVLLVLLRLLASPPKRPAHTRRAKALLARASGILSGLGAPTAAAWECAVAAALERRVPPLGAYRALQHTKASSEGRLLRAAVAYVYAMGVSLSALTGAQQARAALRAESRCRAVGLRKATCLARSFRRRSRWHYEPEPMADVLHRNYRTLLLGGARTALWNAVGDLVTSRFREGGISRAQAALGARLLLRGDPDFWLHPLRTQLLFGSSRRVREVSIRPAARLHLRNLVLLAENQFDRVRLSRREIPQKTLTLLRLLSLGVYGLGGRAPGPSSPTLSNRAHIVAAYDSMRTGEAVARTSGPAASTRERRIGSLLAAVWEGESLPGYLRAYLVRQLREETSWAVRLVMAVTCAMLYLRRSEPRRAARACADAADAYRSFIRLCRKENVEELPRLLRDYEAWCGRVLASFEPPIDGGADVVRTLVRTAKRLPRNRRKARPHRVMDALDALITAGHTGPATEIDERVVHDVARMLGSRVLFHRAHGHYLELMPQAEHTLSTWTIHRLVRETRLRRFAVRPRPEFWQPEQRRPGALVVFPVGEGVACIGRRAPFTRREVRAIRTVLRFLKSRRDESGPSRGHAHRAIRRHPPALAGEGLIGESGAWRRVLREVAQVAPANCSVVLEGETGTGKERLARAIHSASARSQGPFVPLNCGAIVPDLLSSELFGHIRGAFTGAHRSRSGVIRKAHRGTLFLDEVADMPPAMQVALLRVLEERRVVPVGSARAQDVDVRVLCATHKDLREEVAADRFREDLFHRLSVVGIRLPALRERAGDLALLADHLLAKMERPCRLHPDALPVLSQYAWPGNVRELDNVLRAAALLSDDTEITPEALQDILDRRRERAKTVRTPVAFGPRTEALLVALGSRWLSSTELAAQLGVSARTVNRDLARLVRRGLVQTHGEARARVYRRTAAP